MSASAVCPRCGTPHSLANRFCSRCGTSLSGAVAPRTIPAPPGMMVSPSPPPASENLALFVAVLVVAIVVVLAGVFAVVLSVRPNTVPTPPASRVIGVNVARSSDGRNWVLTFTSVPTGLTPFNTMLAILTSGGVTALSATPLGSLNYSSVGALYAQAQPGGPVAVGDRLLINTSMYPTGFGYQLSDGIRLLAYGTLQ